VNEKELDALLAAAAAADEALAPPPRVEAALRAAYREIHVAPAAPSGSGRRAASDWIWAGLAAAAAVVAITATLRRGAPGRTAEIAGAEQDAEFLPLGWGEAGLDDVEALQVMAVQIPRSALASLGYTDPLLAEEGAALRAELLVGNDGMARGIRFVQ